MTIELPKILQNIENKDDGNSRLEKWLHQFASARIEMSEERIRMPKMLTSDNLSTWLSTRYANRNKNKQQEFGPPEVSSSIRQARKKIASGRSKNMMDTEQYLEWLTPKRAKMMESSTCKNVPSTNTWQMDDNDEENDSSTAFKPVQLLSPFYEQLRQTCDADWYKPRPLENGGNVEQQRNISGLLGPYFEASSKMKVDDWLARNKNSILRDSSPLSEWLKKSELLDNDHHYCMSSLSLSPSPSKYNDLSLSGRYNSVPLYADKPSGFTTWLANEQLPENQSFGKTEDIISDANGTLLTGFNGLSIANDSSLPESSWIKHSESDNDQKSAIKRTWLLDDYGSFLWATSIETKEEIEQCVSPSGIVDDIPDERSMSSASSNPFNMNDWLIVVEEKDDGNDEEYDSQNHDQNDDGSSIVILNMSD